jgi:hypothetical protein
MILVAYLAAQSWPLAHHDNRAAGQVIGLHHGQIQSPSSASAGEAPKVLFDPVLSHPQSPSRLGPGGAGKSGGGDADARPKGGSGRGGSSGPHSSSQPATKASPRPSATATPSQFSETDATGPDSHGKALRHVKANGNGGGTTWNEGKSNTAGLGPSSSSVGPSKKPASPGKASKSKSSGSAGQFGPGGKAAQFGPPGQAKKLGK